MTDALKRSIVSATDISAVHAELLAMAKSQACTIAALRDENARLREALTESHDAMMEVSGTRNEAARIVSGAIHAARAALGGKP